MQRQAAILRIVRERRIHNQEDLRQAVASEGYAVTQATLSRDIRELGLAKLTDPQHGAYYAHPTDGNLKPDLAHVLPALVVSVDGVGPFDSRHPESRNASVFGSSSRCRLDLEAGRERSHFVGGHSESRRSRRVGRRL